MFINALSSLSTEYYNRLGRITWAKISEHPDHFLRKTSRPQSDHVLQEPSRMTEAAVNTWLEHWVGRQGRGKLPLMLIDPSTHPGVKAVPQTSSNKGKKRMDWVEPDDNADDEVNEDDTSNGGEQSGERSESPAPSGTYSE